MKEKKQKEQGFKTSIGGQALLEGILMRGPTKQAIVTRGADGTMTTKVDEPKFLAKTNKFWSLPFFRGIATFVESMAYGMKALTYSAEQLPDDMQEEPGKFDQWIMKTFGSETAEKIIMAVAMVLGLALAVALFVILPTVIVGFIPAVEGNHMLRSLLEGIVKLVIFLSYMWGVSNMKDVARVFGYHGAEHKTIFCYEHGLELTVENVKKQSRFHPRCGTSFLLVVVILGIFLGFLIQFENVFARMGCRILLLPVLVGIAYEINRWAGGHDNWLSTVLTAPGKALQRLTTKEPDDSMMECAIEAMKLVIPEEKGLDAW